MATALAPRAMHLAMSPLLVDATGHHEVDVVNEPHVLEGPARQIAAIRGMPVSSEATCGPAPVPPSAPSR